MFRCLRPAGPPAHAPSAAVPPRSSHRTAVRGGWAAAAFLGLAACSPSSEPPPGPVVEGDAIGVAGAHEHGVVRMGVAVDGVRVTLDLEAPAEALFGFERPPETEEERAMVAGLLAALETDGGSLIRFDDSLSCSPGAITLTAPGALTESPANPGVEAGDGHEHGDDHAHDDEGDAHDHSDEDSASSGSDDEHGEDETGEDRHEHSGDDHLEIALAVEWSCDAAVEGTPATLGVAGLMPRAQLVDLTVVTASGSAAARVTASDGFRF